MRLVQRLLIGAIALLLLISGLLFIATTQAQADSGTITKPSPTQTTVDDPPTALQRAALSCIVQKDRHMLHQSGRMKFWYPTGGLSVFAHMRVEFNQIYDRCKNGPLPSWGAPMAWQQCWEVEDYASTLVGNLPDDLYAHQFHAVFTGVSFKHSNFQKTTSKRTTPLRYETDDDGTRHNCRLIQESIDDRPKFRFILGAIKTGWHATVGIVGRFDPSDHGSRVWRPNEDLRLPLVG